MSLLMERNLPVDHLDSYKSVACCILHLLILLAAFALEMYYFHDRKRRQGKEYDVRMELAR